MDLAVASTQKITQPFDGQMLKLLVAASLKWLRANQQTVNALNVFPVPDGDTGTNMVLTMQAAYHEIDASHETSVSTVAYAVAHGALMGARGNSGVILSQLWRGFARALDGLDTIAASDLVRAFAAARDTAYKGVVRPVEGTILTVAKDTAAAAELALTQTDDPYQLLQIILPAVDQSVAHTPELLPVLKQAGVVDSGGKGFFFILEGMARYLNGQPLDEALTFVHPLEMMDVEHALEVIEPGQDYEVVIDFRPHGELDLEKYYAGLEALGTSIQVGEGDGIYRMHIHVPTAQRYEPIDFTMTLGVVTQVHIENLIAQMEGIKAQEIAQLSLAPVEPGSVAVVVVAPGMGIARIFASLGAAAIVEGGQTMNPSTGQLLDAIRDLPSDQVVILPNNKNIVLAAQSAVEAAIQENWTKTIRVLPTVTVPQGLAAICQWSPDDDLDAVVEKMQAGLQDVSTIEITTATRSVEIDGVNVREGQCIALLNGKLSVSAASLEEVTLSALAQAQSANYELITLFTGDNITPTETEQIVAQIRAYFPDHDVEVLNGGQAHYHFIISLE